MKNFFQNLKIKIRGDNITLPESRSIAPIVYSVLAIAGGIGIISSVFTFFDKTTIPKSSVIVSKPPPLSMPQVDDYEPILTRNVFNIDGTLPDSSRSNDVVCTTEPKKSSLAYKVTGIIFGGDAKSSIALLEQNSDKKSFAYKLGDTLPQGQKISDISMNKVYIATKNCPEYLEINYPSPPPQRRSIKQKGGRTTYAEDGFERVGNHTTVTKQWVNDILNNKLSSALEDARAVPYLVDGQVKGFSISQIIPDSVYAKLGLKDGDVISNINGIELNDAARAIQTLNSLRSESRIDLNVMRGGQSINLKVDIQ